jgi:hypothetical protein
MIFSLSVILFATKISSNAQSVNNALNFDGVNDYVDVSQNAALAPTQITLECWVKPNSINANRGLVTKEPTEFSSEIGYGFRQRADNIFWFVIGREGYGSSAASTTHIVAGTWYHLAGTFDGIKMKLYVDGVLESTTTTHLVINSSANLKIGILNSLNEAFIGNIDEVRVWNVVHTQTEIQADMNTMLIGNEAGLVAYYPFNQGIAGGDNSGVNTLEDITANHYDGTLNNFALNGKISNWVTGVPFCPAPTNLKVLSVSDTSAVLKWTLPADSVNGFDIGYHIMGSAPVRKRHVTGNTNHIDIGNLQPGTTYRWKMRSDCTADTTQWINGPDFTTLSSTASLLNANAKSINLTGNTVQILPNPNKGNFVVQMQLPVKAASTTFILYNNVGTKVWQQNAGVLSGPVSKSIDLENKLSPGVYMLIIQNGDMQLTQKVVVNK